MIKRNTLLYKLLSIVCLAIATNISLLSQASFEMVGGSATGVGAAAIGDGTIAGGKASMALGLNTSATKDYSFASGNSTIAGAVGAFASGFGTRAYGINSVAMGVNSITEVSAIGSVSMGGANTAKGDASVAMGQENTAFSFAETVIGQYSEGYSGATTSVSKVLTDRIFTVGNGTSSSDRSNAMVLYKSGDLQLYGRLSLLSNHNVLYGVDSTGAGNRSYWISEKGAFRAGGVFDDIFDFNTGQEGAEYWDPSNIGDYSVAFGQTNLSKGNHTMTWGSLNAANQAYSSAWGNFNEANAENSTVWGQYNIAKGKGSTVLGTHNVANSFLETVIGQYADTTMSSSADSWVGDDMVFVVGNGTDENDRKNALTVLKNGNVGLNTTEPTNPIEHSNGAKLTSAGIWTDASDRSRKYDLSKLNYGLATVMKLIPMSYKYNIDQSKSIGFIAQDIQKIIPEVVYGEDGNLSMAYGQLTAVLTKSIQELNLIVQSQAKELQQKDNNLDELEDRISHLENLILSKEGKK